MSQITKISVNSLKVHPKNQEFFDDIDGEQYEKFKKSIQEDGIITPLIVAPDMTILSGHQRLKAAIDLGFTLVPVLIKEEVITEEDKLKKLLATNFGRLKNNPVKQGKVYSEYEKLCGIKKGNNQFSIGQNVRTQEDIAKELGVDVRTVRRLKQLQQLSPELQDLIEEGTVKYTTALNVWSKLSEDEQSKLIDELGQDKISEMTQKQTQQYILEKQKAEEKAKTLEESNRVLEQSYNELSQELQEEKKKPEKTITVEVDNTDYTIVKKNEELKEKYSEESRKLL